MAVRRPGFTAGLAEALEADRKKRQLRAVDTPPRDPVLARLGRVAGWAVALAGRARTVILSLGGLASLTAGAWVTWGRGAGFAVTGASLLVLEWLSRPEPRR